MTVRRAYRAAIASVAGVSAVVAFTASPALASDALPTAACTNDAGPFTGVGSTLQTNAINNVFNPALTGSYCGSLTPPVANPAGLTTLSWGGGGSGAGNASQLNRTSLIAGSDDPINQTDEAKVVAGSGANASPLNTVPVLVAPVSIITNLPCAAGIPIKLSSPTLAKIYDGVAGTWDNPLITAQNPGLASACPGVAIKLTARADVSGTTHLVKQYLANRNAEYKVLVGQNTTWLGTIACRGTGTGGEIGCVKNTPNSIGYAATSSANRATCTGVVTPCLLATSQIDNPKGVFALPTGPECTIAAAAGSTPASTLLSWGGVNLTDSGAAGAYGICGLTYDYIFQNTQTAFGGRYTEPQVRDAVDYLESSLRPSVQSNTATGPNSLVGNGYGALPTNIANTARTGVSLVTYS